MVHVEFTQYESLPTRGRRLGKHGVPSVHRATVQRVKTRVHTVDPVQCTYVMYVQYCRCLQYDCNGGFVSCFFL